MLSSFSGVLDYSVFIIPIILFSVRVGWSALALPIAPKLFVNQYLATFKLDSVVCENHFTTLLLPNLTIITLHSNEEMYTMLSRFCYALPIIKI